MLSGYAKYLYEEADPTRIMKHGLDKLVDTFYKTGKFDTNLASDIMVQATEVGYSGFADALKKAIKSKDLLDYDLSEYIATYVVKSFLSYLEKDRKKTGVVRSRINHSARGGYSIDLYIKSKDKLDYEPELQAINKIAKKLKLSPLYKQDNMYVQKRMFVLPIEIIV